MSEKLSIFETLSTIDVSEYIEKKPTGKKKLNKKTNQWEDGFLSYLSWMNAWAVVKQKYPSANYNIERFDNKPYMFDEKLGYMVFTSITIDEQTQTCWLPVMDSKNNAMKDIPYTYFVNEYKDKQVVGKKTLTVEAATMFDINTSIMRCLAKNIAMHGLGAYIYAGDDLPFTWGDDDLNNKNISDNINLTGNNVNFHKIIGRIDNCKGINDCNILLNEKIIGDDEELRIKFAKKVKDLGLKYDQEVNGFIVNTL